MRITVFNGNPDSKNIKFNKYLEKLSSLLIKRKNESKIVKLKSMRLNYCIGCYTCWLKTPGICIHKDDGPKILKEYLNSDVVILASPVIMGFISALSKSIQERLLPLAHPYLCFYEDRMQHVPRYDRYPSIILLLDKLNGDDSLEIIEKVIKSARTRKFLFTRTMDVKPEEVANEINGI